MFNFSDADFDDSIEDPFDTREIFDLIRNDMPLFFSLFGAYANTFRRRVVYCRLDRHSGENLNMTIL